MRILIFGLLFYGCQRTLDLKINPGDCVIGDEMAIWKLMRKSNDGQYLFARMPVYEGVPVEILKDIRSFKKVECPY